MLCVLLAVVPVLVPVLGAEVESPPWDFVLSSPLPPLCRSPLESELPSPGSLWCPVVPAAPAVAPDFPLSPPLPELFAPALECPELSELPCDVADAPALAEEPALAEAPAFAEAPALADAFALLSECDELSDLPLDFALASPLPPALLEELEELDDLPPPVALSELPAEPAAF